MRYLLLFPLVTVFCLQLQGDEWNSLISLIPLFVWVLELVWLYFRTDDQSDKLHVVSAFIISTVFTVLQAAIILCVIKIEAPNLMRLFANMAMTSLALLMQRECKGIATYIFVFIAVRIRNIGSIFTKIN